MQGLHPAWLALIGTGFTFLCTAMGAAMVFLFRKGVKANLQRIFLGFAAGVMIAASVWSLLIPSIEMAEEQGQIGWIPAAGGFVLGGLFLMLLDRLLPHLHPGSDQPEGISSSLKRTTMLVFAVTLHNTPKAWQSAWSFALGRTGRRAGDVGGCNGIGPRNGPSKFSRGRGNFPSLAARRLVGHPVVRIRGALRDCRTDWRPIGGFNRWFGDAIDALVPFLCRRRDDLCCGGGTYSGSTPRRTFPPRARRASCLVSW